MGNRKAFIDQFLTDLDTILPSHKNGTFYREYLEGLSDSGFEQLVSEIEAGTKILPLFVPNLGEASLSVERNLKTAKKWGHEFFQKLKMTSPQDPELTYLTPIKYLVVDLPVRRQAQTLESKMSIPLDVSMVDDLTGQVTGDSKGSTTTFPEIQILSTHGLDNTILEFLKVRGGDSEAYKEMERQIIATGSARLSDVTNGTSRVKSTETLSALLKSAHLGNNL